MIVPEFLFIVDADYLAQDYFRYGNAVGPRFEHVRPFQDVLLRQVNGIQIIVANGNGISLNAQFDPRRRNTWKIPRNTPLPAGIKLVKDIRTHMENHYMLAPIENMPFMKYLGLLQELVSHCQKVS